MNTATGNFWHTFADIALPGRGPALALSRTYNSLDAATTGLFGYGWSSTLQTKLAVSGAIAVVTRSNASVVEFSKLGTTWTAAPRTRSTLTQNANGTWTFTCAAKNRYTFDSTGRLMEIKDRNNEAVSFAYPSATQIVASASGGRSLTFTLSSGRVTGVTDSAGRTVGYTYDAAGDLVDVVDVSGGHTTFTYDTSHRLLTMRSPRYYGDTTTTPTPVVTTHYDALGRVDWQTDELGRQTSFDYTTVPGSTIVTDPKSNKVKYTYLHGVLVSETRGYGTSAASTWSYEFDPTTTGRTRTVDPNNQAWTATYDTAGNQLTATDPMSRSSSATYNTLNLPLTATDGTNVTTTYTYDTAGNLLTSSTPWNEGPPNTNRVVTLSYGDTAHPGDVTSMTDPLGKVWTNTYTSAGQLASTEDPLGNESRYCYDNRGLRTADIQPSAVAAGVTCSSTAPAAGTTYYTYDNAGRVLTITDAEGRVTTNTYNANGQLATTTDPNNHTTSYAYDAAGQPTIETRADLSERETSYWADGTVRFQYDPANNATEYGYDSQGRLTTVTDPLNRTTTYGYNPTGTLKHRQDPGGDCTTTPGTGCTRYTYDNSGKLTAVTYSDGTTPNVTNITYNANGVRTGMTDGAGTWSYTYDSLGRMTESTRVQNSTTYQVTYGWNLRDEETTIGYPSNLGTVTNTYDDAGRMTAVTDWLNNTTSFGYDADGNLTSEVKPNATTATYTYDDTGRPETVSHAPASNLANPFATFTYGLDNAGQIDAVTSTGVPTDNHNWGYNTLNQLATDDAATTNYAYDNADNLTQLGNGTTQAFNVANELCWSDTAGGTGTCATPPTGATTYTYDNRGNRTSAVTGGNTTTYTYNLARQLTTHSSGGASTNYTYNADGLRSTKFTATTSTNYTWNNSSPLPVLLAENLTADVYGPTGRVIHSINGTSSQYHHHDQIGSTRALTDSAGLVVGTLTYDPYGTTIATTGSVSTPFEFAGEYRDAESGLTYLRARYYDSATGQFLNRDPLVGITGMPYSYANSNPLNYTDPLGLAPWDWVAEKADDAWDATGGKAVTWVKENPGDAATIVGIGVCVVGSLGTCGVAAGGAFLLRSGERVVRDGFRDSFGVNVADGAITYATFGLVSAPSTLGLTRGGGAAIPWLLGSGERGLMAGAPFWQQALSRFLAATPDLAGLFGGRYFDDGC